MARTVVEAGHLFVVERYLPDATLERLTRGELVARRTARGASGANGVRHRESIWIPSDETVLSTFIAASSDAVGEALRTAGIPADRIVEAVRFVPCNVRQAHTKEIDHA